jgi:hypothetical protein
VRPFESTRISPRRLVEESTVGGRTVVLLDDADDLGVEPPQPPATSAMSGTTAALPRSVMALLRSSSRIGAR